MYSDKKLLYFLIHRLFVYLTTVIYILGQAAHHVAIVVSPLISLMRDQERRLSYMGIRSCVSTDLDKQDINGKRAFLTLGQDGGCPLVPPPPNDRGPKTC